GVVPIHQRVVEPDVQSLSPRRVYVIRNNVVARPLSYRVVGGQFGVEVAETLMMLGCQHHVLHACAFCELRPSTRASLYRLESPGVRLVLVNRDGLVFHHPFVARDRAIYAEMDEHTEARLMP